jgi:hypothetical protein
MKLANKLHIQFVALRSLTRIQCENTTCKHYCDSRMNRKLERWYPPLCGVASAAACFVWAPQKLPNGFSALLSSTIDVCAITVGFMGTIWTILLSIEERPIMQRLKEAKRRSDLITFFASAVKWTFALGVWCAFSMLVMYDLSRLEYRVSLALGAFILTTAAFSCFRVIRIFGAIMHFDAD